MLPFKKGISHRDLIPENIVFDIDASKSYVLKIIDYATVSPMDGRVRTGVLFSKVGHPMYWPPEIHRNKPYFGHSPDLFAAAIILFIMIAGKSPFSYSDKKDPLYKCLTERMPNLFWKMHNRTHRFGDFHPSAEFKSLFEKMMEFVPKQRPTIDEILKHPWMSMPLDKKIYK